MNEKKMINEGLSQEQMMKIAKGVAKATGYTVGALIAMGFFGWALDKGLEQQEEYEKAIYNQCKYLNTDPGDGEQQENPNDLYPIEPIGENKKKQVHLNQKQLTEMVKLVLAKMLNERA